jgi:prolyl oligopeptidase
MTPALPEPPPAADAPADAPADDPYLWLEDIDSERALAWVHERNAESEAALQSVPGFADLRAGIRGVLDARDQIPQVSRHGDHFYNLWRDAQHPRGLWRRTSLAEYRREEPAWQTVLDLDALGRAEGENWVWAGAQRLAPGAPHCLVSLSRGGADATVVREFDLAAKAFVADGFALPEAKCDVEWIDADTVYVATDTGPGAMTDSGYPRTIRRWRRGQPLAEAALVFEGEAQDVSVRVSVDDTPGWPRTVFTRSLDFYNSRSWLLLGAGAAGEGGTLQPVPKPDDAGVGFWRERVLIELRSDWVTAARTWRQGSLLVGDAAAFMAGGTDFEALFEPTPTCSLAAWAATRDTLLLTLLDEVASRLEECRFDGGRWQRRRVATPAAGTLSAAPLHDPRIAGDPLAEAYWLHYTDYLTPDTLQLGHTGSDERETLKSRHAHVDAEGMRIEPRHATSADGTRVPYFVVWPRGAVADGRNPTVLYGYGGFEVSLQPYYSGAIGRAWTGRGGVWVVANIRGGGEFGPAWHQAALREHRQRAYDDFAAVAADLIATGVTSAAHLGIEGGSNGGLLVGAVMLQRPELFAAVVCQVPLLDMRRYHRLLAGASWMAEYGNPDDPADWAFISRYSPYQNVRAGTRLPTVLFTTSTRDDRVHPGHARKMAARMREQGHRLLYWENTEGGHGGAADNAQRAQMMALEYGFFWRELRGAG